MGVRKNVLLEPQVKNASLEPSSEDPMLDKKHSKTIGTLHGNAIRHTKYFFQRILNILVFRIRYWRIIVFRLFAKYAK